MSVSGTRTAFLFLACLSSRLIAQEQPIASGAGLPILLRLSTPAPIEGAPAVDGLIDPFAPEGPSGEESEARRKAQVSYNLSRLGYSVLWGVLVPGGYLAGSIALKEYAFPLEPLKNPLLYGNAFCLGFGSGAVLAMIIVPGSSDFLGDLNRSIAGFFLGLLGGTVSTIWQASLPAYSPVAYYAPPSLWLGIGTVYFGWELYKALR